LILIIYIFKMVVSWSIESVTHNMMLNVSVFSLLIYALISCACRCKARCCVYNKKNRREWRKKNENWLEGKKSWAIRQEKNKFALMSFYSYRKIHIGLSPQIGLLKANKLWLIHDDLLTSWFSLVTNDSSITCLISRVSYKIIELH
jgi:hypothetical protein